MKAVCQATVAFLETEEFPMRAMRGYVKPLAGNCYVVMGEVHRHWAS